MVEVRDKIDIVKECTDKDIPETKPLNMLMPDTWNNVAWVVSNSIETLIDRGLKDAKAIESLK